MEYNIEQSTYTDNVTVPFRQSQSTSLCKAQPTLPVSTENTQNIRTHFFNLINAYFVRKPFSSYQRIFRSPYCVSVLPGSQVTTETTA